MNIQDETVLDLNNALSKIQTEHFNVIQTLMKLVNEYSPMHQELRGHLQLNYKRALDNTKKSAGQETLDLWAASDMPSFNYGLYCLLNTKIDHLRAIERAYQANISALQSRVKLFKIDG